MNYDYPYMLDIAICISSYENNSGKALDKWRK